MTIYDHLKIGVTTVCYCWIIRRLDGVVLGFTDHDRNLTVDGVVCNAATGITTTKIAQHLGLTASDLEVEGVIDNDLLTDDDIRAGLYDGAVADVYLVNWQDPTQFSLEAHGKFGNLIETDNGGFQTEFRSRVDDLTQSEGRTYQRTCQRKLGDAGCGVDLTTSEHRVDATVTAITGQTVTVSGAESYETDWFTLGTMILADGARIGVRLHRGTVVSLWNRPPTPISVGDTVTLVVGCKQDSETCRVKFENLLRFDGFPFIPGNDRVTAYPIRGREDYAGGSLFK